MTDLRKAAEQALEALHNIDQSNNDDAIEALHQALAQPEQEPVAFVTGYFGGHLTITCFDPALVLPDGLALYTTPPKREWVGLTREDKDDLVHALPDFYSMEHVILAAEAKLKEKNANGQVSCT